MKSVTAKFGQRLSIRAAAQYLGIGEDATRRLIARGELVAVRSEGGRTLGVYTADCDRYLERARQTPSQPAVTSAEVDAQVEALLPTTRRFH